MVTGEETRRYYDGLTNVSADLWRAWLRLYQRQFDRFFYNVRVGAGVRPPASFSPEDQKNWWALTSLRIDAVGERPGETWVFEIAERPGSKILGQLQLYTHILPLYQGQSPPRLDVIQNRNATSYLLPTDIQATVIPALICRFLGSDYAATVANAGILTFVFPGAGAPKLPANFPPL